MPEDIKPKATLIKQSRSAEMQAPVTQQPQQPQQKPAMEKKRVVIVKKKPQPQVVVKTKPAEEPKETAPVIKQEEVVKTEEAPVTTPKPVAPQQPVKKVVKKPSNVNTTISNGPVIISGANLPPINFGAPKKSSSSGPVGSVGGVVYGSDGKRIPQNRNNNRQGQPNSGVYTPRSSQNRRAPFGKDRPNDFGAQRQGGQGGNFRGPNAGNRGAKGGFAQPLSTEGGKNKRVFSKDKGRDRRHEIQEDELELKQFEKKKASGPVAVVAKSIDIMPNVTVSDLAKKMNIKASDIISKLFSMGMMVSINQSIDSDTATIIAEEYGCQVHIIDLYEETVIEKEEDREEDLQPRAPIVTVMGHVDHGKTKLLDAIRSTNVVAGEFGGITQHIGAYKVSIPDKGDVVFLDTPGHAAFTLMRARGAQVTDIVVLVVAANDGVMPQTIEAIDHAKAAGVPIIVAINKIDLPEAKPERVMQQLSDYGLMPEEWGGQTLYCQISAKQKIGIENLLDTILLQAEMMDLKANPNCRAEGRVLEARIDQGRGIVASVIIERGTLKQGDYYVSGIYPGRVRAMFNDKGKKVKTAGPSTPVEVIGLSSVPSAGDPFQVCEDEKQSRIIGSKRQELERQNQASRFKKVTLENMFDVMHEGDVQELNLVIKGDVQGSVEALKMALEKLSTPEIRVSVIRAAAGAIIEDDINLASASENPALVIGFNVRPTPKAQARADEEKIDIRKYNIIYNVVDDVKAAMEGMLSPERTEVDVGTAEVRQVFKVPKVGLIAGCFITSGSVKRNNFCRVVRDNIQLSKELLKISSLKRFKDDAREVTEGFECGIGIENFQDLKEGDIIEFVEIKETARKLDNVWERI